MRAFVGLPCPEPWIGPLVRAQGLLRQGRRVDPGDLHLTLAFLDDQSERSLEGLHEALEAKALPAARLTAMAYAALGSSAPRAVVLDLVPDAGLTTLHHRIRAAARGAGIDLPRTRFRPHITLARFSRTAQADTANLSGTLARLGSPDLPVVTAAGITLWSSVLTPDGPIYDPLSTYPLRAA